MRKAKALVIGGGRLKALASVELAETPAQKAKGLSGRSVKPGEGMRFRGVGAYWMRGCAADLDIAFTDARGRVLEVLRMKASPEPWPLYKPSVPGSAFAFEFSAGWLASKNAGPGDQIIVTGETDA